MEWAPLSCRGLWLLTSSSTCMIPLHVLNCFLCWVHSRAAWSSCGWKHPHVSVRYPFFIFLTRFFRRTVSTMFYSGYLKSRIHLTMKVKIASFVFHDIAGSNLLTVQTTSLLWPTYPIGNTTQANTYTFLPLLLTSEQSLFLLLC